MTKSTTKIELLKQIRVERERLEKTLSSVGDEQMEEPGVAGEWSVKDVLAHLFDWEQRFLGWYEAGLRGEVPHLPAPGFNWRQLPLLNQQIYEKYHAHPLSDVKIEFANSYQRILEKAQAIPEEEMFTRSLYAWMGPSWSLADFIAASTSSHYRWARTLIRRWTKSQGKI